MNGEWAGGNPGIKGEGGREMERRGGRDLLPVKRLFNCVIVLNVNDNVEDLTKREAK